MIASDDVRRVKFDRVMRGYRCEDVEDYLNQVADSMDSLAAENDRLQEEIEEQKKNLIVLAQRIDQYRADEDTLSTTMINAQRLGENVIKEAKQKAAEIIRAANIKAEDREQRARDEVELAQQEVVTLKQEADAFKKRLMELYRQHIEMIAKIPEYHKPRTEQPAPQPEAQPAPQQPVSQPIEQPAPAPQPEPTPEPEEQTPQYSAPEETYPQYEVPEYYEAEPEEPARQEEPEQTPPAAPETPAPAQPLEEEKIDTVEFAFAPKMKPLLPDDDDDDMPSVAGLYGGDMPDKSTKKGTGRSRGTGKNTRKTKTAPKPELDAFDDIDYDV